MPATRTGLMVEAVAAAGLAAAGREASVFTPLCGAHLPWDALRWAPDWRD